MTPNSFRRARYRDREPHRWAHPRQAPDDEFPPPANAKYRPLRCPPKDDRRPPPGSSPPHRESLPRANNADIPPHGSATGPRRWYRSKERPQSRRPRNRHGIGPGFHDRLPPTRTRHRRTGSIPLGCSSRASRLEFGPRPGRCFEVGLLRSAIAGRHVGRLLDQGPAPESMVPRR